RIGEHLVRRGAFLEPLLGLLVAGVPIGVILERHLSIGALQLLVARVATDFEHLVKVTTESGHTHRRYSGDRGGVLSTTLGIGSICFAQLRRFFVRLLVLE